MYACIHAETTPCDRRHELHSNLVLQHSERNHLHTLVVFSTLAQKRLWLAHGDLGSVVEWNCKLPEPSAPSLLLVCKSSLRRFLNHSRLWPLGQLVLDNVSLVRQKWPDCQKPRALTDDNVALLKELRFEHAVTVLFTPFLSGAPAVGPPDRILELLQQTALHFAPGSLLFLFRSGEWQLTTAENEQQQDYDDPLASPPPPLEKRAFTLLPFGGSERWRRLAQWYQCDVGGDEHDCELMRLGLNPVCCRLHPAQDAEVSTQLAMIDLSCNFARRQTCYMKATALADELARCCSEDPVRFLQQIPHPTRNFQPRSASIGQLAQQLELVPNAAVMNLQRRESEECPICCDRALDDGDTALPPVLLSCGHAFCLPCCVRLCADVIVWQNHFWEMVEEEGRAVFRLGAVVCPLCRANVSKFHPLLEQSQQLLRMQFEGSLADTLLLLPTDRLWVVAAPHLLRHELERLFPEAYVDDNNVLRIGPSLVVMELQQVMCYVEQLPRSTSLVALTSLHAGMLEDMQTIFEQAPLPVLLLQNC